MKKLLIYIGGQLQIGLFWGSFLYILGPRYGMGMFWGITKFQGFFFFLGGGGVMPDIPIF